MHVKIKKYGVYRRNLLKGELFLLEYTMGARIYNIDGLQ